MSMPTTVMGEVRPESDCPQDASLVRLVYRRSFALPPRRDLARAHRPAATVTVVRHLHRRSRHGARAADDDRRTRFGDRRRSDPPVYSPGRVLAGGGRLVADGRPARGGSCDHTRLHALSRAAIRGRGDRPELAVLPRSPGRCSHRQSPAPVERLPVAGRRVPVTGPRRIGGHRIIDSRVAAGPVCCCEAS